MHGDRVKPQELHSRLGTRDRVCIPNVFDCCDIAAHYNRI